MIQTEQFRQNLYSLINNSNVRLDIIYYVFKDVMLDISNSYQQQLRLEQDKLQKQQQSVVSNNTNDIEFIDEGETTTETFELVFDKNGKPHIVEEE